MAEKVMDSLVDRILELESMTETISTNDRRFIAVDDTDVFVQAQQNENTRRMTDCHIVLPVYFDNNCHFFKFLPERW